MLSKKNSFIDVEAGTLTLRVQDQSIVFSLFEAARKPAKQIDYIRIDVLDGFVHANFMAYSIEHPLHHILYGNFDAETDDEEVMEVIQA